MSERAARSAPKRRYAPQPLAKLQSAPVQPPVERFYLQGLPTLAPRRLQRHHLPRRSAARNGPSRMRNPQILTRLRFSSKDLHAKAPASVRCRHRVHLPPRSFRQHHRPLKRHLLQRDRPPELLHSRRQCHLHIRHRRHYHLTTHTVILQISRPTNPQCRLIMNTRRDRQTQSLSQHRRHLALRRIDRASRLAMDTVHPAPLPLERISRQCNLLSRISSIKPTPVDRRPSHIQPGQPRQHPIPGRVR